MKIETYLPSQAKITKIIDETPTIKTFRLQPEKEFSFKTGQFIELAVAGIGEAPFTPSSDPESSSKLEVTVMKVGLVTEILHNMKEADIVGIRGPYGNGYPVEKFKGKQVYIIGGGVGLAPLRSLIFELLHSPQSYAGISLYYGARTPEDIVYKDLLKEWEQSGKIKVRLTVDKADSSWNKNVGVVTTILDDLNPENAIACVCGPPIMMKFTTLKLLELGFREEDIYLSMEKNMSCGVGKCGHCRIGYYYVCKDGPVFTYDQIKEFPEIWD
ncbi:MAG TPA: oxidoreductase [Candidatus Omnitrophica bacterium]|nr:oxidoreductase [Candidatus Omnitrophota bacterium]